MRRSQELVQLTHAGRTEEVQPAAVAEDAGWECVGRRNTSFVARTHQDASTPVTDIFGAHIAACRARLWFGSPAAELPCLVCAGGVQASVVKRSGAKPSVTQEPFKMLSLVRLLPAQSCGARADALLVQDVSTDSVFTLEDALSSYCAPEALEGFQGARGEETSASRSLHIAEAPRVLLLSLKLFRFTQRGPPTALLRRRFAC